MLSGGMHFSSSLAKKESLLEALVTFMCVERIRGALEQYVFVES